MPLMRNKFRTVSGPKVLTNVTENSPATITRLMFPLETIKAPAFDLDALGGTESCVAAKGKLKLYLKPVSQQADENSERWCG